VSRKVSADMFGMALRAYIRKLRRLRESESQPGSTLWRALLDLLGQGRPVSRAEILAAFARDDEVQVGAVLRDLCESGLVFATGGSDGTMYRAASEAELAHMRQHLSSEGLDELVWALVYREGPLDRAQLVARLRMDEAPLQAVLQRLCADGRVIESAGNGFATYRSRDFSVPLEARKGWEAAVFDHFQAMVQTIAQRLAAQSSAAGAQDHWRSRLRSSRATRRGRRRPRWAVSRTSCAAPRTPTARAPARPASVAPACAASRASRSRMREA
jgi:hypothetical protein